MILSCAIAFVNAQALELSFWLGNQKIEPGSTVEFNNATVVDYGTYKEVTMKPELTLSSNIYSSSITVVAECTSGQSIQMCAGGVCRGGKTVTKEKVTVRTGEKLDLGFDYVGEFDPGEAIPVVTTHFTAEDTTEPGSKVEFVLVMSEGSASLIEIEAAEGLEPVKGGVRYDVTGEKQLSLYNLEGVCVFTATLSGSGVAEVPAGLYLYSLGNTSGKILVK